MKKTTRKIHKLILAIAPSSRGFGYAVMEGNATLVDWGVKSVSGNKNVKILKHVEKMMVLYHPETLVLDAASSKGSRRHQRIRMLIKDLMTLGKRHGMEVVLLSRTQVMRSFFIDGRGTKHTIARILASRFSAELGHRLPPKRVLWKSEAARMAMFEAVALAYTRWLGSRR